MGCAGKVEAAPSLPDGGGIGSISPLSFLKFEAEIIIATDTVTPGIVYSINGGALKVGKTSHANPVPDSTTENITLTAFVAESLDIQNSFFTMEPDLFGSGHAAGLPPQLDQAGAYLMGVGRDALALLDPNPENALPPEVGTDGLIELTLYPARAMPSAGLDIDLFDKVIDPINYTQADLQYFADLGVEPAVKNPDGSYTLKSQLTLPPMG